MAAQVTFRPATAADLPMVLRAERDYMETVEPEALQQWVAAIDRNLELWIANLERMSVAQTAGHIAGFVMWTRQDDAALVITVQVLPDRRRHGIGLALLQVVTEQVRAAGLKRVKLGVHASNPARSIYAKAGYTRTGRDGDYLLYELLIGSMPVKPV